MPGSGPTVFSRPAWNSNNPYTSLLAEALERQGMSVREVGLTRRDLPLQPGVLILHWPDEFYKRAKDFKTLIAAYLRLVQLTFARRFRGVSLVWVAHNVHPHQDAPTRPPLRWKWFLRLVDGFISLSREGTEQVLAAHPVLAGRPVLVTNHGHYLDRALCAPSLPQPFSNRPADRQPARLAALGAIRPNKRFVELARLVAGSSLDATLAIRGATRDETLRQELEAIDAAAPKVNVRVARMSDAELEEATDAADLVVLPYSDILNSGALFYALSRYRPVVAPRLGSIPETQRQVGAEWIFLFDGELDEGSLAGAIAWLRDTPRTTPPDLSAQDWDVIGRTMATFLTGVAT